MSNLGKNKGKTISSYEGRQNHIPALKTPEIENWEFMYPNTATDLPIEVPELTSVCPRTGRPAFATLIIEYRQTNDCLELKSFNEYLLFYHNLGILHEHITNKVLKDSVKAIAPKWMKVTGIFNSRGGIQTTVVAKHGI
ncbi:7-cyano-7-deazaguanine reductase [Fibrobacteria bacterium R8-3-H12]